MIIFLTIFLLLGICLLAYLIQRAGYLYSFIPVEYLLVLIENIVFVIFVVCLIAYIGI